ncbi:FecCD family ABC transporter permease [Glutamicibacter sp.]|uniref:FecCD family ABC transporter permease n=1 Tax=Glutamicibacter sp. TaxID=1931995 RepID=UPI002FE2DFA3
MRTSTRFIPRGYWLLTVGRATILVHRRSGIVALLLLLGAVAVAGFTVATGTYQLSADNVLEVFFGGGSQLDQFIVLDQRVPRAIAALLVGAALGASGSIFQSVSRNPLGSPDIVGFTTGAATGGLLVILLAGANSAASIMAGTLIGGLVTAAVVLLFALRRFMSGDRIILAGVAIGAMLAAVNDYLISRASIENAETAKSWQYGSLNAISWAPIIPLVCVVALAIPAALIASRVLRIMELGEDTAFGVGVNLKRARLGTMAVGVLLAAIAVATAGPIGFLALAAPQLARKLSGAPGISVAASTTMGAMVLVLADLLAQRLLAPFQIPVGLVTGALGGAYLLWLLTFARSSQSSS